MNEEEKSDEIIEHLNNIERKISILDEAIQNIYKNKYEITNKLSCPITVPIKSQKFSCPACENFCQSSIERCGTCQIGCGESTCEHICTVGCTSGCVGPGDVRSFCPACENFCQSSIERCGTCQIGCGESTCEHICTVGCTSGCVGPGDVSYSNYRQGLQITRKGLYSAIIDYDSNKLINGEINSGKVKIECNKAIIISGTEAILRTADNENKKGPALFSTFIDIVGPLDAVVEVNQKSKDKMIMAGYLLSATGEYNKNNGIVISKNTDAIILLSDKAYTGKIVKELAIGMDRLDTRGQHFGIRRLTMDR